MIQVNLSSIRSNRPVLLAWSVHLFTATGAVWGLLAIIATIQHNWQVAFFWLGAAALVDSLDGALARRFRVKGLTPGFDGALLDNIIDYQTYVIVPALFLYEANLLPPSLILLGIAMLVLASAFQFCQADAKTEDHAFKGFPSYWNVVVFYLFMLDTDLWFNLAIIALFSFLAFVPIKYVYPSRMTRYQRPTLILTGVWGGMLLLALLQYPVYHTWLVQASLLYVVYYFGLSLYLVVRN